MMQEIEQLIIKRRRKVYEIIKAKKEVKPEGYFIVKQNGSITEIIVPGIERFITTPQMKDQLGEYIKNKWNDYSSKLQMDLLAVVLMTDAKMLIEPHKKGEPIEYPELSPCQDPTSTDVLFFTVRTADEGKVYGYPYKWEGKRLKFLEEMEDVDLDPTSRMFNLWPIKQ